MPTHQKFLIVDDNPDSRFLLVKTLLRKFPNAVVQECKEAATALALAKSEPLDAIIVHRASEMDGLTMIRALRESRPSLPIVMTSGIDRSKEAIIAGASAFLNYDAWLRVGTVVAELLTPPSRTDLSSPPFAAAAVAAPTRSAP